MLLVTELDDVMYEIVVVEVLLTESVFVLVEDVVLESVDAVLDVE